MEGFDFGSLASFGISKRLEDFFGLLREKSKQVIIPVNFLGDVVLPD